MPLSILVTGASGYIGSQLIPRLLADGHHVRGFARTASHVDADIEVVEGDASTGEGLEEAMDGVDVAYFLIHAMEGGEGDFDEEEKATAEHFVGAGKAAGVRRVVFLGGVTPEEDEEGGSEHLESRHAVEEVLLKGFPEGAAFRASLVIGAGSSSFDLLASLVERMPVLALPSWRDNVTSPIDRRDAIEYLALAASSAAITGPRTFEIAGATELSYGDLVQQIADVAVDGRPSVPLPFAATPVASRLTAVITGQDKGLVTPLMESLAHSLPVDDAEARRVFGVTPRDMREAIADAVAERQKQAVGAE